jgi:AcrR family transcriptional regulator
MSTAPGTPGQTDEMRDETAAPLSGRRAEASRNDARILDAAREIFLDDPEAPISKVAERAGVGMSALYRRYESKEDLLNTLCWEGLRSFVAIAEEALERSEDAAGADLAAEFVRFMEQTVESEGGALVQKLAGTFTARDDIWGDATRADQLGTRFFERCRVGGVLRDGIGHHDLTAITEMLASVKVGDRERSHELRRRYLALLLEAVMNTDSREPLPASPPTWQEISGRWTP